MASFYEARLHVSGSSEHLGAWPLFCRRAVDSHVRKAVAVIMTQKDSNVQKIDLNGLSVARCTEAVQVVKEELMVFLPSASVSAIL